MRCDNTGSNTHSFVYTILLDQCKHVKSKNKRYQNEQGVMLDARNMAKIPNDKIFNMNTVVLGASVCLCVCVFLCMYVCIGKDACRRCFIILLSFFLSHTRLFILSSCFRSHQNSVLEMKITEETKDPFK